MTESFWTAFVWALTLMVGCFILALIGFFISETRR